MQRKGNPSTLLVGMQIGAATVENSKEFPQKLKNVTALLPRSFMSRNSKKPKTLISKKYIHPYYCNVIYNSQDLEAAQVFTSRRLD